MKSPARLIAFYLPQYHPIAENDAWWEPGFTEWTNVTKAKPLFPGHYQPRLPADLGYYDLRVPEVRAAQAAMAADHGIEGFCYYHYWFAGKRIIERPFHDVLASGKPGLPFCLCWANETWTGIWHGAPNRILIEQTYPGEADYTAHFESLLPAFRDPRYIRVDGKPMFCVYSPGKIPDPQLFTQTWRKLAAKAGLPGLHLVGLGNPPWNAAANGFDAASVRNHQRIAADGSFSLPRKVKTLKRKLLKQPIQVFDYDAASRRFHVPECRETMTYPCAIPNWDNTPRSGKRGLVFHDSTPELFRRHLRETIQQVAHKPEEHRIVFVKSWNEWAEGNYLEPDRKFGYGYLNVVAEEMGLKPPGKRYPSTSTT